MTSLPPLSPQVWTSPVLEQSQPNSRGRICLLHYNINASTSKKFPTSNISKYCVAHMCILNMLNWGAEDVRMGPCALAQQQTLDFCIGWCTSPGNERYLDYLNVFIPIVQY